MTGGGIGVERCVDIQAVGLTASCRGDVEHFSSRRRGDEGVSGVCCSALAPIRGRGVSELYVVGDVIGGERDLAAAVPAAQCHAPVGVGGGHQPAVAVLDPGPAGGEEPVVLTGDDLVAYSCFLAISYQ